MGESERREILRALQPVVSANSAAIDIAKRLAIEVDQVQDPKARELILKAADELLGATGTITDALRKVAGAR